MQNFCGLVYISLITAIPFLLFSTTKIFGLISVVSKNNKNESAVIRLVYIIHFNHKPVSVQIFRSKYFIRKNIGRR